MRLSSKVVSALRGASAALVIAGASGCGASVAPALAGGESTTNGALASERAAPPKADPAPVAVEPQPIAVEDVPAPCGRG